MLLLSRDLTDDFIFIFFICLDQMVFLSGSVATADV